LATHDLRSIASFFYTIQQQFTYPTSMHSSLFIELAGGTINTGEFLLFSLSLLRDVSFRSIADVFTELHRLEIDRWCLIFYFVE